MSEDLGKPLLPTLKQVLGELAGRDLSHVSPQSTFFELGFDSLLLTQVAALLKKRFRVKISFRQLLAELTTLEAIASYVAAQTPPAGTSNHAAPATASTPVTAPPVVPPNPALRAASTTGSTSGSGSQLVLERVIREQMTLMARQLEVLSGRLAARLPSPAAAPEVATPGPAPVQPQKNGDLKSFGPFKGVEVGPMGGLTPKQAQALTKLTTRYNRRTAGSKAYAQQHRPHFCDPRTAGNFRQLWKEMVYPIVCAKSNGGKLWDIDGNEYVDLTLGFGANYFGHAPEFVVSAVAEQLRKGFEIGPQSPLAGETAQLLCAMTGLDRATFCNTGSEAVMAAMRAARTVTGRDKIVYFSGDYHGIFDEVLARAGTVDGQPGALPVAPGIPPLPNMIVLEYNLPASLEVIRQRADEIAAVIVEPVQSRHPDLQPKEFLHALRQLTTDKDIALIFDEVVTGFRLAPGGAQEYFGVRADLATYGKVVGGGMPIGVLAGTRRFMDVLDGGIWRFGDDSFPEVGVTFFAGTFVRHPLAMAAAHATLKHLQQAGPELQRQTTAKTARFVQRLNDYFTAIAVPIRLQTFGSVFYYDFHPDLKHAGLLFYHLRDRGIHIWEGRVGQLCTAHTEAELDFAFAAFQSAVEEMQAGGFLPDFSETSTPGPGEVPPLRIPLTEAQREIWLSVQMGDDANCAYNESCSLHLEGFLDLEKFHAAIRQLVQRHDALRCRFSADGEFQEFSPGFSPELPVLDLSGLLPAQRELQVEILLANDLAQPFDLVHGPVIRLQLLKLAANQHQFIFTTHHAVCDGWSFGVIFQELSQLYSALAESRSAGLKPAMQFREYAAWCAGQSPTDETREAGEFWVKKFAATTIPTLDLPYDRPRPALKSYPGSLAIHHCAPEVFRALKQASGEMQNTVFTTLFSAFLVLLHRLSGQEEIVVGIPAAGQNLVGSTNLVGHCLNFLPTRNPIKPDQPFAEFARGIKSAVLDAFEHQNYTYGTLLQKLALPRDVSRLPLLSVMFNLDQPGFEQLRFAGLKTSVTTNAKKFVNFDLFVNLVQAGDKLDLQCEFNTDLFDRETVLRWLGHFETLISAVTRDARATLGNLPLSHPAEQNRVLVEWNQTRHEYPRELTIPALFAAQVRQYPGKVAVRCGKKSLTYAELDAATEALAGQLVGLGCQPGDRVGVCLERSVEMVVGVLGILKSGAAYVPMDPAYPAARLAVMIEDAAMPIIVTHSDLLSTLPSHQAKIVCLDQVSNNSARKVVGQPAQAGDLAYVIFTSGSTGRPKGVQIQHRAVVNFLNSMRREPGIRPEDVLLSVTTLSFDIAGLELFLPLTSGATLVVATSETTADGNSLRRELERWEVTFMQATPVTWTMLLEAGWTGRPDLKILCGGEALPPELARALLPRGASLWNMYGPTETTIWSTLQRIHQASGPILIGRPIDNTQCYIVDGHLRPQPVGLPGELLIGGDGLAVGYLNQPELTAEKFIRNPFSSDPQSRLYRTGDLARYLPDGNIACLGRIDQQVKLRGFRIELGEIESVLRHHPAVKDCVVDLKEDAASRKRLVGYVSLRNEENEKMKPSQTADLLGEWHTQWETTFSSALAESRDKSADLQNLDVIINRWTGLENGAAQTAEWIETTVKRLQELRPARVLEVGCGTGQLLLRLAPHAEMYWGTDFALAAIKQLRREVAQRAIPNVNLLNQAADHFAELPQAAFDLFVLNSVSQYFPDVDYLTRVILGAANTLHAAGRIFVGDVQSRSLLECFHAAALLKSAPGELTVEQLRQRVGQRVHHETELVVDPEFFPALQRQSPRITAVEVQLRRGRMVNETTQYHYDAILHLDANVKLLPVPVWLEWTTAHLTIARFREQLELEKPPVVGLRAVPNRRLEPDVRVLPALQLAPPQMTVAQLREKTIGAADGIDPEDLWILGDQLGYHVDIRWSGSGLNGMLDVVFSRAEERGSSCVTDFGNPPPEINSLSAYANDPAGALLLRQIPETLKRHAQAKLPDYMVPSAIVVLATLPRTPNGKLDRRALPAPSKESAVDRNEFVAPRNDREQALADIWMQVLGLEKVSVLDNFFALGGDSLLSFRIANRASQAGLPLTPRMFFQHKTIADLVRASGNSSQNVAPPVAPAITRVMRDAHRRQLAEIT